ncbi:ABC transporter ATP-binding protein [Natronorarus salvus]|uniref:ABC transporter ATP-binding protein n=1 Tax=Natronorarus salvus TaxID=3117733 RepID=UPI002F26A0E0
MTDVEGAGSDVGDGSEFEFVGSETAEETPTESPLVSVKRLEKYYDADTSLLDRLFGEETEPVRAVDDVSFDVFPGETLGVVGESGCGKSTTGETLLRLREATGGSVLFDGEDVFEMDDDALSVFRTRAQIVFQDPFSSLDPRMTVGQIVREPLDVHDWPTTPGDADVEPVLTVEGDGEVDVSVDPPGSDRVEGRPAGGIDVELPLTVRIESGSASVEAPRGCEASATVEGDSVRVEVSPSKAGLRRLRAQQLLERVGLSAGQIDRYPNEFSGGQRQRIGIARAIALEPEFIVLDEPVSALDVSVQAQVLNLLADLQDELGLTYLFIAHDLSVVRHISDRVAIMYLGKLVEIGPTDAIFDTPAHPYTEALLESVPRAALSEYGRRIDALEGDVPSPRNPPSGCRFRTRCPALIQPEGYGMEQSAWRAVATLRDGTVSGEFDADAVDRLVEARVEDGGEGGRTLPTEEVAAAIRSEFGVPERIGDREAEATLSEAITALAERDVDHGRAVLERAFVTPCEERVPPQYPIGSGHGAACLLHEET